MGVRSQISLLTPPKCVAVKMNSHPKKKHKPTTRSRNRLALYSLHVMFIGTKNNFMLQAVELKSTQCCPLSVVVMGAKTWRCYSTELNVVSGVRPPIS